MEEEEEIVIAIVAVTAAESGGGLAPATDPGTGTGSGEWKYWTCFSVSLSYTTDTVAGNEPSLSFKFYNHGEAPTFF